MITKTRSLLEIGYDYIIKYFLTNLLTLFMEV